VWAATPRFKGVGPERIAEISNAEISNREIIDAIKGFYIEQAKKLEARLQDEFAPGIRVPVEKEAADVLYVPLVGPSAATPREPC
jgi:hypothetical protein